MKQLAGLVIGMSLLIGCRESRAPSFTIIEHSTPQSSEDGREHYVIRYDNSGHSVILNTRCGWTQYRDGSQNQGFCPSERLPALGSPISECGQQSSKSEPCALRTVADFLIFRGERDEIDLQVESEKVTK